YRKRLNPKTAETYRIGESGPEPCARHSRWRKYAFTYNDLQNSQYLRWGNVELGGSFQSMTPHKVEIETVEYLTEVPTGAPTSTRYPTGMPSISGMPSVSLMPTSDYFRSSNGTLLGDFTLSPTAAPSLSSAPSALPPTFAPTYVNILGYGDMEGPQDAVLNSWPSQCSMSIVQNDVNSTSLHPNIHSGQQALSVAGGRCFVMRHVGPSCFKARMSEDLLQGDVVRISLYVKILAQSKQVFQIESGHYHTTKPSRWAIPSDDSHIIARTLVRNADEWTKIEAIHTVGPDWTFNGVALPPKRCNHYQFRFRVADSTASFVMDDVRVEKVTAPPNTLGLLDGGFLSNPDFVENHKYWKYARNSGYITQDDGRNVMVLGRGKLMRQDVLDTAVPDKSYQMSFYAKFTGVASVDVKILLRMRFKNNDLVYGPCTQRVCNLYERPLRTKLRGAGTWHHVVADEFRMFGNYTDWDGSVDFIIFELVPLRLPSGAEFKVAKFEFTEDRTLAPSISLSPSAPPTTLMVKNVGYVVKFAGEFRTVVHKPFQLAQVGDDSAAIFTGEQIPMNRGYQLCEIDEVEGNKLNEFPSRMNFIYQQKCVPIMGGNPTVDVDPRYVNLADLHVLNIPANASIVEINSEQTLGGDLLLLSDIENEVCSTFPNPYDNDYRGADRYNPDAMPSRFQPDKPVFARLPDGSYALYDQRLILHENTLENPKMDGGGESVLRSTIRAARGFVARNQTGQNSGYHIINDKNIALCINEQPNFINMEHCKISYEPNTCQKQDIKDGGLYGTTLIDVQLVITFDDETLLSLYTATLGNSTTALADPRYIYAVTNLRYDSSNTDDIIINLPCGSGNPKSRWIPRTDLTTETCTNTLQEVSVNALKFAIESSNDENSFLRDIVLWNNGDGGCDPLDELEYGMLIMTKEGCWENVHPDHLSVFDFTDYISSHPTANVIESFVDSGVMVYPSNHSMSFFEDIKDDRTLVTRVARFGDKMIVDQLADKLSLNVDAGVLVALADKGTIMLDNAIQRNRGGGMLVCGSPNEVAPDPELDDYFAVKNIDLDCVGCQDNYKNYFAQKQTVLALNMLHAEDQLCQRMAWALYELLYVGTTTMPDNTEGNLYSYDIMTRNCFGTYDQILKEMTYNPKMGEQFNYIDSSSTRFHWDAWYDETKGVGKLVFPDENYAREVMQLFSIGLHELELDGTETRDKFGREIQTYDNVNIMNNARVMTGFTYTVRARRGNTEELFRATKSRFEPFRIDIDKHDFFPKQSIEDGWIGDRYPLCEDLPKHHFLKIGATYRFRAGSSIPTSQYMPASWDAKEDIKRFVLSPDSMLYNSLCNPDAAGNCNFSNIVTLDENLNCLGHECTVDTVIIVQISPGAF
ncbi:hypothetical protein ACHAXS_003891, partial [Conticribra weissflogii]